MADPNPIEAARLLGVIRGYATALDDLEAWLVDRIARAENAMARIRSVNGNPTGSPRSALTRKARLDGSLTATPFQRAAPDSSRSGAGTTIRALPRST